MGQSMPKAVTSVVVKRWGGTGLPFRAGLAEMNGWRPTMEDAHVVVMQSNWGFFGVFDGHGGSQCSSFIASRLTQELETSGMPEDDEAVTALALKLDREYLQTGQPSGSTGTFVIMTTPTEVGGNYGLRVGNIGDSRVLLGRSDGTMVEGNGTDGGLTTDHKPDHPDERARIERTGGTVQEVMGVCRVNGDLAVSRAFGDPQYKETGGPLQEDHPVTAAPELCTLECSRPDFLILVCDGISECNFPNREVVQLAAEELKRSCGSTAGTDEAADPGAVATAICRKALECGSKDNLSCMIVLLGSGEVVGKRLELLPGAVDSLSHEGFRKAYEAMAEHAGLTLPEAVEARYEVMQEELRAPGERSENSQDLHQELAAFGEGPPQCLAVGSEERTQWFARWVQDVIAVRVAATDVYTRRQGKPPSEREPVVAAGEEELRAAIKEHFALHWDDRYLGVCGKEGFILKRDDSDNTSQVRFEFDLAPMNAWFPDAVLRPPRVQVAELAELRTAIEGSSHVEWDAEKHPKVQGQEGLMLKIDDSKETCLVRLLDSGDELWVPSSGLVRLGSDGADGNAERKRLRTE